MPDKASAAGWVIEVVTLRQGGGPPLYKYFNVAIADVMAAVQATLCRRHENNQLLSKQIASRP